MACIVTERHRTTRKERRYLIQTAQELRDNGRTALACGDIRAARMYYGKAASYRQAARGGAA